MEGFLLSVGIPRLYAAASLKPLNTIYFYDTPNAYSAALCRGLIEACGSPRFTMPGLSGIPRLYAAASLKRARGGRRAHGRAPYSAALCRGLIEAPKMTRIARARLRIPRLYAAASLKPAGHRARPEQVVGGIPRLYAAASLKPTRVADRREKARRYSAALCRGLIEATWWRRAPRPGSRRIPRLYAAASLKRLGFLTRDQLLPQVFRGSMPRPH